MNKINRILFLLVVVVGIVCLVMFLGKQLKQVPELPEETTTAPIETTLPPETQAPVETVPVPTTEVPTEPSTAPTEPPTEPTTAPTEPVNKEIGETAANVAKEQVGKEFVYGTAGPDTFDASGLLQYLYKIQGIKIPRSTADQAKFGVEISRDEILPGDAVFFWTNNPGEPEFVGIYIGDDQFVAACNSSRPVSQMDMSKTYYVEHYVFARRFYGSNNEG